MNLNLSEFFVYLATKKSFYNRLASSLERVVRPGLGTMAVGIRDGRAVFFFDPKFLSGLSLGAGLFALEHEMLHLVLDHIPRYLELLAMQATDLDRKKAAAVYNIAMDCSINTMLRGHEGFEPIETHLKNSTLQKIAEDHAKAVEVAKATHAEAVKAAKAAGEPEPDGPDLKAPEVDESKLGMVLPEKHGLPLEGSFESYQYLLMQKVKVFEITVNFMGNTHEFWNGDEEGGGQGGQGNKDGEDGKGSGKAKGRGQGNQPGKSGGGGKDFVFNGSTFEDMSSDELLSAAHRIREQIKETLRQTVRSLGGIGRGTLPGSLEEWLEEYLRPPIIPWWEIFMTRARMSRASKIKRSAQQLNRSLLAVAEEDDRIIPSPGRLRDRSWRVILMVDTSGSMSSESLKIINDEMHYMLMVDDSMELRYIQGDCEIQDDVVLHSGDSIPREVKGRGGTDFNVYFEHMAQYIHDPNKSPDLVIVYTDGYAPPVKPENRLPPDVPILWLVTPEHCGRIAEDYGEIIICDPAHNERRK